MESFYKVLASFSGLCSLPPSPPSLSRFHYAAQAIPELYVDKADLKPTNWQEISLPLPSEI